MSVTVIKGRSGSGKSRYLTAHIRSLVADPFAKVIVIVPGSLTFETEKNIIQNCRVSGILGLQVFSIQRLAYAILDDTESFLTNAQKAMVCKKALNELRDPFHGVAASPDFLNCLSALISRLKSYNQTPQSLRAAKTSDSALLAKLNDTADVFEQYQILCGTQKDSDDMYALAAAKAPTTEFLKDAHVVIDGMDSYCPAVMLMITQIIAQSAHTVAAFRHQGSGSDADLFAPEAADMQRFIEAAKTAGKTVEEIALQSDNSRYSSDALKHLQTNLYKYPYDTYELPAAGIRLIEAQTSEHEVDMIASSILCEVADGRRYCDIAVVVGNLPQYVPAIKMKFALHDIPFFIDERRALSDNTFFDFLSKSLLAAAGDALYITNYAYSKYAPLDEQSRYDIRKYAQDHAYKGWHFGNVFWRGDDAAQAEKIRQSVMRPLFALEDGLKRHSATKQIDAILQFLKDCDIEQKLEDFCERLDALSMSEQREYYNQVYAKTLEVLNGISGVFGDKPITPAELIDLLKTGCNATKIAVIPPSTDEVGIFDISLARLKNIDVLFAAGVQDGVWPSKNSEPGIMSAQERESLYELGIDIGVPDLSAEKLKVYTALIKPKDKLHVSYNLASPPSVLIDRIKRIFPKLTADTTAPVASLSGAEPAVLGQISDVLNGGVLADSLIRTCAAYLQQDGWKRKAESILTRTNAALRLSESAAIELYGGIKCSATRIESYYKCPFAHFVERGLKAKPVREFINALDTGSYLHLALDIFARGLLSDEADIAQISVGDVQKRAAAAAKSAAEQYENAKLLEDERYALLYPLLTQEIINTAKRIKMHFDETQAEIFASEQRFDNYTISTKYGEVTISGKIDRIDTADGYFRVVDYKSSSKSFSLEQFANGIALQLPIYIEAAKRLLEQQGDTLLPSGGYYMEIGEGYKESDFDLAQDRRLLGISLNDPDVLARFSAQYASGGFTAIDQRVTSKGALHGGAKNKFFTESELRALLNLTNKLIRDAAQGIYSGDADIRPAQTTQGAHVCDYCEYKLVCMMDEGFSGNEYRQMTPFDKSDLEAQDDR